MTSKNHGCCGHTFAAIDGALALRAAHKLRPEDIVRIRVATYQTALDVTGSKRHSTPFEGKFSLPFVVASALTHGSVRLDAFTPERLGDPRVADLVERVEIVLDPELSAAFPGRRAARVAIETTDGRRLSHDQMTRKGDPDDPLSDAQLVEKYRELAAPVIGARAADALLERLWSLERQRSVD